MANFLLDSIVNETLRNTVLRSEPADRELLENLMGGDLNADLEHIKGASLGPPDQPSSSMNPSALQEQLNSLLGGSAVSAIEMGFAERLFWVLIFSVMVLVAAGGNTVVAYIVTTNKEMKSVTNYFLVNLSLADTMVSTLNVIFNFISMLISHWPFGKLYCKISNFIAILSISASVFTLTAISCDRYNAILHPLRPRMSHGHAIGWILLIWTLSSALALPNAIYSTLVVDRLTNDNSAITCAMVWPDGRYPLSSYDHIYNIIVLVVTYLVPILTMAILYYKVGKELWGHEAIGENVEKQQAAILAKRKIVKMMIVVVIIFALCWLPYHAFFVVNYYIPTIFQDVPLHYQRCYLFMYWLAMSNSMYNPIIIYFMNSKFRQEIRKTLCFLCCCIVYVAQQTNSSSITRQTPITINNNNCTTNLIDTINDTNAQQPSQTSTQNESPRKASLQKSINSASGQSISTSGRGSANANSNHRNDDRENKLWKSGMKGQRSSSNRSDNPLDDFNCARPDQIQVIISRPNSELSDFECINQPKTKSFNMDETVASESHPFITNDMDISGTGNKHLPDTNDEDISLTIRPTNGTLKDHQSLSEGNNHVWI